MNVGELRNEKLWYDDWLDEDGTFIIFILFTLSDLIDPFVTTFYVLFQNLIVCNCCWGWGYTLGDSKFLNVGDMNLFVNNYYLW